MNQTPTLSETKLLPQPASHTELVNLLAEHDLPVGDYGRGGAKSTHSIWAKIEKGETDFGDYQGTLVRILPAVARAMITHTDNHGFQYLLVESNQGIYRDEHMSPLERHLLGDYEVTQLVSRQSRWGVWETMHRGEDPQKAMVRGICEELVRMDPGQPDTIAAAELQLFRQDGIENLAQLRRRLSALVKHQESRELFEPPLEYPGLGTLYIAHTFHLAMPPFLLRFGYATRNEEGKLNIFNWVPLDVSRDVLEAAKRQQQS